MPGQETDHRREKSPILFHPDTGYVFVDDRMGQLPSGPKKDVTHTFALTGRVTGKDIKQIIAESGSTRSTGTVMRELNIWYAGKTPDEYEPADATFVHDRHTASDGIEYQTTREIQIITDDQLDGLANVRGANRIKTPRGGAQIRNSEQTNNKETSAEKKIKILSENFGIYEYKGRKIKIPNGIQLAQLMLLSTNPMLWLPEDVLLSITPGETDEQKGKTLAYALNNIREQFRGGPATTDPDKQLIQSRRADIPGERKYEYRLGIPIEKEKPKHPSMISAYQASVVSNLLVLRNGIDIKIGNDQGTFSVNGLGEIKKKLDDDLATPVQTISIEKQRQDAFMNIELFLKVGSVEQEQFIRRHDNPEVRELLRWIRDENERGSLQGTVYYFLTIEPSTITRTELYQNPQTNRKWVAPPEAIAAQYIKRKQREQKSDDSQQLLVAFT